MPALCIPNAQGVPGLSGPPNWFDSSVGPPGFNTSTDDPRWRGAFAQSLGDGTLETASFRALHGQIGGNRYLFLSWFIRVDPSGPNGSQLYLGLGRNFDSDAMIIRHSIPTATTTTAGTGYATDIYLMGGGGSFDASPTELADPAWIGARTRMWVNYSPSTTPMIDWAIQMAVPFNEQLSPDGEGNNVTLMHDRPFRIWFAAYLGLTPEFDVIEVTWPDLPGISGGLPAYSTFAQMQTNLSSSPPCSTEGVTISTSNIGTRNADNTPRPSASRIKIDTVNNPPTASFPDEQNMFYASPTFPAGMSAADRASIRAHFRLANWGSTIGDPTTEAWNSIPGGENVSFNDADDECRFIWPTPADVAQPTTVNLINAFRLGLTDPTLPGAKHPHQCMLVELSSVGSGVTFLKNSVYRNMNIESASTFEREAEISLRPGSNSSEPRDVYLYEKTYNMPDFIPPQAPDDKVVDTVTPRRQGMAEMSSVAGSKSQMDTSQLARWMPTYTVQVYHDTQRTTTIFDGKERRILKAQTSYGYFIDHEGPLYGWKSSLEGATDLGNGWHKLSIPENGAHMVKTTIEADENPGCGFLWGRLWQAFLRAIGQ